MLATAHDELDTQLAPAPYPFLERFGPYYLTKRIGRGGMAEVFKAVTKGSHRFFHTLAVKRVLPDHASSVEHLRMFAEEARVSALLHHPNLVHVHDFGKIDGRYFIAMEYLRGWSLARVLGALSKRGEVLPTALAAYVAQEVAAGLAYAHALTGAGGARLRIVHRDVHPGNVMLLRTGGVKLLDFGVAKANSANRLIETRGNVLKGTLSYLAPEQIEGGVVDERSDVFALGVSLWEMLTGQRLFAAPTEFQVLKAVLSRPVVAPSAVRADVPPELDAVVLRALDRDPARRYVTADAMAEDLETYVRAQGVRKRALPELLRSVFHGRAVITPTTPPSAVVVSPPPGETPSVDRPAELITTVVAPQPKRATRAKARTVALVFALMVTVAAFALLVRRPKTSDAIAARTSMPAPMVEALTTAPLRLAPVFLDATAPPRIRRRAPRSVRPTPRPAAIVDGHPVIDGLTIDPFAIGRAP